jgi:ADP-ribose pyrophosphatase
VLPWKKVREETLHEGYQKVVRRHFERPDGRTADFEIRLVHDVICVVARTVDGTFLIARQYRPGPERVVDDLTGGGIEAGEDPEAAARRELLEETGYQAGTMTFVATNPVSAYSTNFRHTFVATACRKVAEPQNDAREHVEVVELSLEAFRAHLRSGKLTDVGSGYLGLDALGLL